MSWGERVRCERGGRRCERTKGGGRYVFEAATVTAFAIVKKKTLGDIDTKHEGDPNSCLQKLEVQFIGVMRCYEKVGVFEREREGDGDRQRESGFSLEEEAPETGKDARL